MHGYRLGLGTDGIKGKTHRATLLTDNGEGGFGGIIPKMKMYSGHVDY
jgi:hypothetical protein